jgi:hypothetical protein
MRGKTICVISAVLFLAASTQAGVIFSDDFESGTLSGVNPWATIGTSSALTISTAQNTVPAGGQYSALLDSSLDGMQHPVAEFSATGPGTFSYWLYDDAATRAWGEVRAYDGVPFVGGLQQLFAAGKYTSVTMAGDIYNDKKYQGRITGGTTTGWFNLTNGPDRSTGWHQFDVERLDGGTTINWYVDGILARTITGATTAAWDSALITSVRSGSTAGNAYFDGILVTDGLVPEPGTFSLLALGALGLLARRRA